MYVNRLNRYFAYALIIVSRYVAYAEFAAAASRICEGALAVNDPQPEVTPNPKILNRVK